MPVYSVLERQAMLEDITAFAEKQPHITALIVVGSGAFGYTDELSDLDFVVGLDGDASMASVMDDMAAFLKARAKPIYFKQAEQRHMQVLLSDRYLEIDIPRGGKPCRRHVFFPFCSLQGPGNVYNA